MIYLIALLFAAGLALGAWGDNVWNGYRAAKAEQAAQKAEAQIKAKDDEIVAAANHEIDAAVAAKRAAEEKAKASGANVTARIRSDVAKFPAFQNVDCKLPAQSFALYVAALRGMHTGDVALPADAPAPAVAPAAPALTSTPGVHPKPVPRKKAGQ